MISAAKERCFRVSLIPRPNAGVQTQCTVANKSFRTEGEIATVGVVFSAPDDDDASFADSFITRFRLSGK